MAVAHVFTSFFKQRTETPFEDHSCLGLLFELLETFKSPSHTETRTYNILSDKLFQLSEDEA
jgi:hypothetical protein